MASPQPPAVPSPPSAPPFACSTLSGAPESAKWYLPHSSDSGHALAVIQSDTDSGSNQDALACHGTPNGTFSRAIQRPFPEMRSSWAALIADGILYFSGGEKRE